MFLIKKAFINKKEKSAVIDSDKISLSWQMESDKKDVLQTAYKIKFFNDKEKSIWETERIIGSESINVVCNGIRLEPLKDYYYKIISWNNYEERAESGLIHFETGIIKKENWIAKWIEADTDVKSSVGEFNIGKVFTYHPDYKEIENINLDPPIIFEKEIKIYNKKIKTRKRNCY